MRRNPTKLLSLSKRLRLEVSCKDRFHQFGEDDFIVLGIFLDCKSSFSFNQDDVKAVMACKPNVCKPNSHFGSGGFVASFGTKASCGALGFNGKSIGQCYCRKCLFQSLTVNVKWMCGFLIRNTSFFCFFVLGNLCSLNTLLSQETQNHLARIRKI